MQDDYVYVGTGRVQHTTPKAVLVEIKDQDTIWIPRSVIEEDTEDWAKDDEVDVSVMRWFAKKELLV